MKKTALILIAALTVAAAQAQSPDAIYKLLRQQWTVNTDGTTDYRYRHEVQILRNRALTAYADKGETFVTFNPDLEELTVNEVYTLRADGSRVDMPQNAFIYQLPSSCADCGRYNHLRELAMVHTGMELGCTVVVDYTIHRRYNLVNQTVELVRDCPVERWEVSIAVPEGQELGATLTNPEVLPITCSESRSSNSYSLIATHVAQSFNDSYLPAREQIYPSVHFFNAVPEYLPALTDEGLPMADEVIDNLYGSRDAKKNIEAIRNYVVDNIHLNDIDPVHLAYRRATPAEVWQSACGTAAEKAALLAAMLRQANYSARVIGDQSDEVGVTIDTVEYRMSIRDKAPMTVNGKAEDEVATANEEITTADIILDTLQDGFYRLHIPPVAGSPTQQASRMALTRTAPMAGHPCDLTHTYTATGLAQMKMAGAPISEKIDYPGVGSVEVSIKQSGKKITVKRHLVLEKNTIQPADYAHYRELIALWQGVESVLLRKK